jgi:hypothetical protein
MAGRNKISHPTIIIFLIFLPSLEIFKKYLRFILESLFNDRSGQDLKASRETFIPLWHSYWHFQDLSFHNRHLGDKIRSQLGLAKKQGESIAENVLSL